ncbi:hypothetical protein V492_02632 [Pseudogymnoascus sp. VKM F-4246]|nr:hypothetical protein V492_02632 [Pseudogymnoascus sp. VKM F-4246]
MSESKSEWYKDQFFISTSQDLLQIDVVNKAFNSDYMYWTKGMSDENMKKMLSKSLCFGVYLLPESTSEIAGRGSPTQIGLGRLITDESSFAYLTDVFIIPEHQANGLGRWLMQCINETLDSWPSLRRAMLFTKGDPCIEFYKRTMGMGNNVIDDEYLKFETSIVDFVGTNGSITHATALIPSSVGPPAEAALAPPGKSAGSPIITPSRSRSAVCRRVDQAPEQMDNPDLTPWFQQEGQGQQGAVSSNIALFQLGVGYGFSGPEFDNPFEFGTPESQFLPRDLTSTSSTTSRPRPKTRVSLACIPCRSRHTKCDATVPACTQCLGTGRTCVYAESRRGRGKQAVLEQRQLLSNVEMQLEREERQSKSASDAASATHSIHSTGSSLDLRMSPIGGSPMGIFNGSIVGPISEPESSSKLLDMYYDFFHDAHPYVLPRKFLDRRLQLDSASLRHILPVLEFIGSLFARSPNKKAMQERAESLLLVDFLPANGFSVQALLSFAIAVHSCDEFVKARGILDRAISMALRIGMNSEDFAISNADGCTILAESWRRTWWYLYLTDGIFSGIRHLESFELRDIKSDVNLPCEDSNYNSGDIPRPYTLEEYNSREFAGEDIKFSSFAYLVDVGHIVGAVLALGTKPGSAFEPDVVSADARLMNWIMYLPKEKQLIVQDPGKVDEVMFQAIMLYNTLKVYLHRPRSQLAYGSIEQCSRCAPPPSEKHVEDEQRSFDFHTTKVLEAAEAGTGLFTLPSPFTTHSPLAICGLTLLILAQISACRFKLKGAEYKAARDRVRLGLGAIKVLGEVWAIGQVTVGEIQIIARDVLSLPRPGEDTTSANGSKGLDGPGGPGGNVEAEMA